MGMRGERRGEGRRDPDEARAHLPALLLTLLNCRLMAF